MSKNGRRISKQVTKWLHRWHRYFGLAAAVFVVILAVTGSMLNHTEALRLKDRHLTQPWLLALYGIGSPEPGAAFPVAGRWVSQMGDGLFVDDRLLQTLSGNTLKGAAEFQGLLLAALSDRLLLVTPAGELVDELALPGIESLIRGDNHRLIVKAGGGEYVIDADFTEATRLQTSLRQARPVQAATLPVGYQKRIAARWRGRGLPLERVLLDLHSGRIFGRFGVWLMDGAALLLLLLTLTGLATWFGRKRRRARNGRCPWQEVPKKSPR